MLIICWDFDGTLITSEVSYKNIFLKYIKNEKKDKIIKNKIFFSKYGGKYPMNVFYDLQKNGFIDKNLKIEEKEIDFYFEEEINKNGLLLTKNIINLLNSLNNFNNIIMSIVTSTTLENFLIKFNNFSLISLKKFFNLNKNIYICEEVGNKESKPSPNGYLYAINDILLKNNILEEKNIILAIEDSPSGCLSAFNAKKELNIKNSKILVIGYTVSNPFSDVKILKENGADYVFNNSKKLFNFIKSLFF